MLVKFTRPTVPMEENSANSHRRGILMENQSTNLRNGARNGNGSAATVVDQKATDFMRFYTGAR